MPKNEEIPNIQIGPRGVHVSFAGHVRKTKVDRIISFLIFCTNFSNAEGGMAPKIFP